MGRASRMQAQADLAGSVTVRTLRSELNATVVGRKTVALNKPQLRVMEFSKATEKWRLRMGSPTV